MGCLYRLGRSLSVCAFSLHFNRSPFLQLPPFCLVYNYSFFQFICFRLLPSVQYLFVSMFLSPSTYYLFVRRFPFDLFAQYLQFETYCRSNCAPGSSVGIATDYWLDGPGSIPGGNEIFLPSRPALGLTQPLV